MRRILAALVLAATAGAGLVAVPGTAGAGSAGLSVDLVNPIEPLTLDLVLLGPPCNAGTFAVQNVGVNGHPVEPVSVTLDPGNPNAASMVLPSDTDPGSLVVVASCIVGAGPLTVTGFLEFASVLVTKIVEGPAPPDATFTVHADCVDTIIVDTGFDDAGAAELPDNFTADLGYEADGGVAYLYSDHAADCTLTEPQNGGATTVTFDPEVVEITAPEAFAATVTNTFVEPIVVEPTFTG